MSLVAIQGAVRPVTTKRRIPRGYGLLAGALASLGMWAGLGWFVLQII